MYKERKGVKERRDGIEKDKKGKGNKERKEERKAENKKEKEMTTQDWKGKERKSRTMLEDKRRG